VVPGALKAITVDCNLEVRPVKEGLRKSLRKAQTSEVKTSIRKINKEKKERGKIELVNIQNS